MNFVRDFKLCLDLLKSNYSVDNNKIDFLYNKINYTSLESLISYKYEYGFKYLFDLMNEYSNDENYNKIDTYNFISKKWNFYLNFHKNEIKKKID